MEKISSKRILEVGVIVLCFYLLFSPMWVFAGADAKLGEISWFFLVVKLLGGLSLFLYGMDKMSESLKAVAGDKMKDILALLSNNRVMGILTGALVTAVIQSSSVTTVMLVGFVSAGLMSLTQTIGIIMGSNIGTTITAQIIAFKVTKFALLLVAVGFGMLFVSKKEKMNHYGYMIMGLGLIFFGMSVMSDAMKPLRSFQPFLELMTQMSNPVMGILVAAIFTALIQSSSATTGVVLVLAMQGLITLKAGIALSFGANIGTCVTAFLATIGKPREALRVSIVHMLFNVTGVIIFLPFIGFLEDFVIKISPSTPEGLSGMEALAVTIPRQIANAHTIFNLSCCIIFLPFVPLIANFVLKIAPDKPTKETDEIKPKYLTDMLFHTPSLAVEAARHEVKRMGERVMSMYSKILSEILYGDKESLQELREKDVDITILHKHILQYLAKISKLSLNEYQSKKTLKLMEAVNDLEHLSDVLVLNMTYLGEKRIDRGIKMHKETRDALDVVYKVIEKALQRAIDATVEERNDIALKVIGMKVDISSLIDKINSDHIARIDTTDSSKFEEYNMGLEVIDNLRRVYYHSKRMAKSVIDLSEGGTSTFIEEQTAR